MDKEVARFCWLWHSYFNNWPVLCLVSIQIVEQVVWQMCPVYGPAIWQSTYILGAKLIFYCILWRIYFFLKKYFRNGKLLHGKMAQFFAFSRISVFAHVISPATDILGFFIFAFSMQNFNFPYIWFPLKKMQFLGYEQWHFTTLYQDQ